jgi:regulator of RNase E activity RraA
MMNALAGLPVSTLCDVDKSLPVADPAIRPITASARLCGPAYTAVATDEFLSTLWAINDAAPGDVLVVQTGGSRLAALGELLAAEAYRRRLGGILVDGYVRDRGGLPPQLPLWARGSVPNAGRSDAVPNVGGQIAFGGLPVTPGDIVVADDDGIVIAPRARLEACLVQAAQIEQTEAAILAGIQGGTSLIEMTNLADHVAALRSGDQSRLSITPPS